MKLLLVWFSLFLTQGCLSKKIVNNEEISINTTNIENCIDNKKDLKVSLTVSNLTEENLLVLFKNVIFDCTIIDDKGDSLKADYKIAHSRDWSDRPYYLVKAHDSINISSVIQKLFYYKLMPGQKYKCVLTYYNDFKEFKKSKKDFKKVKMFRGKVLTKPFYFKACEGI